jgi:hypothetical protein
MEIITDLMSANAGNAELVKLCADVMNDLSKHKKHYALSSFLQKHKIEADAYFEKFHHLCYIKKNGIKEWHDEFGRRHCIRKDKDGNLLPAITYSDVKKWYKDGKPISPGFDKDGFSLPHEIGYWSIWKDENGKEHRMEMGKDGKMLPSSISGSGTKEWLVHGVKHTESSVRDLFASFGSSRSSDVCAPVCALRAQTAQTSSLQITRIIF